MGLYAKAITHQYNPIRTIEWIVASLTFLGGVYLFSPAYANSVAQHGPSPFTIIFTHPIMVIIWGSVLLVGAILVMFGLWRGKPQARSAGWFMVWLARLFQVIGQITAVGLLPLTWIYPFTLAAVIIVLWSVARAEVKRNGTS